MPVPEHILKQREANRRSYQKNKEKWKPTRKKYAELHKKELCENTKRYQKLHPEKIEKYNKENKEYLLWYQRFYRENNPSKYLWSLCKSRATKKQIEFNIGPEDILIPEVCPLLNIKLTLNKGKLKDNSPSVDRIDNSKGYIKGNIWVISHKANSIKNNASLLELEMLVNNLKNREKTNESNMPNV